MKTYTRTGQGTLLAEGALVVPEHESNPDYREYLQRVAEGYVVVPVGSPISVTPWQIRKALNAAGLRASIEAAVDAADQTTQDAWQYATEFRRDNTLVVGLGYALGKTDAELDAVFELAQTL